MSFDREGYLQRRVDRMAKEIEELKAGTQRRGKDMTETLEPMTHEQLVALLRLRTAGRGSPADWSREHGVSPQYLSQVLSGSREAGPMILDALKVRRIVRYEYMEDAQ
jgi:hypothetical protein